MVKSFSSSAAKAAHLKWSVRGAWWSPVPLPAPPPPLLFLVASGAYLDFELTGKPGNHENLQLLASTEWNWIESKRERSRRGGLGGESRQRRRRRRRPQRLSLGTLTSWPTSSWPFSLIFQLVTSNYGPKRKKDFAKNDEEGGRIAS